ncbi:MAG TPA: hydroxymethylbilane synthase [Chthoniobacteraceae bacterium]|jgi:hydroxymethylbilane synthase|nr:hydroxymethylbilane synthase [Chthoniobacteraceae bacterium]
MERLVIGSRGSALALAQVRMVREALSRVHPGLAVELKIITTSGDRRQEVSAGEGNAAGLKGLFTKEIQDALLDGSIDAAVHSLKDLPGVTPDALAIAAVLPRADTSDMLISSRAELPPAARIGTGSVRRGRQLRWLLPEAEVVEIRGNVPTRLQKLTTIPLDAIVLARAGLERLGYKVADGRLEGDAGSFFARKIDVLPAIGQGAVGIETRVGDSAAALLARIDHGPTHACIRVERELLRLLNGDCRLPVGAHATLDGAGLIHAQAIVFHDAAPPSHARASGDACDPERIARRLFEQLS